MISIKILFYSPKCNTNYTQEQFFEQMEYSGSLGADMIVFPEDAVTPYDELLRGADVLNAEEYNYLLESLYGFCFEIGHAAVFCSTDDFGMRYAVFANPFAEDGETYNKLYIKHCCKDGSVYGLEDYAECIDEIFQPIIYRGAKMGIAIGEDMYLPGIFQKYRLSGVSTIICPFSADISDDYAPAAEDISCANNQILLCAGFDGNAFAATPASGIKNAVCDRDAIYMCETKRLDFAKKCGMLKNDLSHKYLPECWIEKYKI